MSSVYCERKCFKNILGKCEMNIVMITEAGCGFFVKAREKLTTEELCPHCSEYVTIIADKQSACPKCKAIIIPCSTCPSKYIAACDWTDGIKCVRFLLPIENNSKE